MKPNNKLMSLFQLREYKQSRQAKSTQTEISQWLVELEAKVNIYCKPLSTVMTYYAALFFQHINVYQAFGQKDFLNLSCDQPFVLMKSPLCKEFIEDLQGVLLPNITQKQNDQAVTFFRRNFCVTFLFEEENKKFWLVRSHTKYY